MSNCNCPICGRTGTNCQPLVEFFGDKYYCKNCGNFVIIDSSFDIIDDLDSCASFLFYRRNYERKGDTAVFGYGDNYIKNFVAESPESVLFKLDNDLIRTWMPMDFSEKVDRILLYFARNSRFQGDFVKIDDEEKSSLFFVKRRLDKKEIISHEIMVTQIKFILSYLQEKNLLMSVGNLEQVRLEIAGWARVDELLGSKGLKTRTAFIAMKFCKENTLLRETIKQGIMSAGFKPIIMDEHEHNNQIVPEMLYLIRQSRFVVVDESDSNLGAYYEAGYAAGHGKPVIHICNRNVFDKEVHFDVKQVNTIMWESDKLDELRERIKRRITATIV